MAHEPRSEPGTDGCRRPTPGARRRRPAVDAFELAVERAIATIPAPFAAQLGSVAIVIEDRPNAAQLSSVGARGLFGLYQGVPRTAFGADHSAVPSKITLFRDTLERHHPDPDDLARAVEETLHHEVAHHLGISDARLAELKREGSGQGSGRRLIGRCARGGPRAGADGFAHPAAHRAPRAPRRGAPRGRVCARWRAATGCRWRTSPTRSWTRCTRSMTSTASSMPGSGLPMPCAAVPTCASSWSTTASEAAAHGAVYVEAIISPAEAVRRGAGWDELFAGATDGLPEVEERFGVTMRLTPDIPRSFSMTEAAETVRVAARYRDRGVVGIGLGGLEAQHPPEPFAAVFAMARDAGLGSVPHAGEAAGPASIRGALDALGADRIRHGVRAIEDPGLVRELAARAPSSTCASPPTCSRAPSRPSWSIPCPG